MKAITLEFYDEFFVKKSNAVSKLRSDHKARSPFVRDPGCFRTRCSKTSPQDCLIFIARLCAAVSEFSTAVSSDALEVNDGNDENGHPVLTSLC